MGSNADHMKTSPFTCLSCQVAFVAPQLQRDHFQSEWHRYNLKRKVAELPPVSFEEFQERVQIQKLKTAGSDEKTIYCGYCNKNFSSKKSFENHEKSKKHLRFFDLKKDSNKNVGIKIKDKKVIIREVGKEHLKSSIDETADSEIEEMSSDEWEDEYDENLAIPITNCLFCSHHSESFEKNLEHMTEKHSFFVPDLQYCSDLSGLFTYLGQKVGCGMICLWCSEKSRQFSSVEATQRHMRDKGHCMVRLEGEAVIELQSFYDYSSSYPDAACASADEPYEPEHLICDDYELTLPSGATIGHRSLLKYYKQRLVGHRNGTVNKSTRSIQNKILEKYRALGWNGASKADVSRRAKDVQYFNYVKSKKYTQLGVKANKLQTYFRQQVLF